MEDIWGVEIFLREKGHPAADPIWPLVTKGCVGLPEAMPHSDFNSIAFCVAQRLINIIMYHLKAQIIIVEPSSYIPTTSDLIANFMFVD